MCFVLALPRLIFANRKDIRLLDAEVGNVNGLSTSSTTNSNNNSTVLLSGLADAAALDFLYSVDKNGKDKTTFCWSDVSSERISCASQPKLSSSPSNVIVSGKLLLIVMQNA